jgi:hypothetical protein
VVEAGSKNVILPSVVGVSMNSLYVEKSEVSVVKV